MFSLPNLFFPNSGLLNTSERQISRNELYNDDDDDEPQGLLDSRAFLSCGASYPAAVFSVIKYEPNKERQARLRKKLLERGGGGTQFAMPPRDWRGISYRALLPRVHKKNRGFKRTLRQRTSDRHARRRRKHSGERSGYASIMMLGDSDDDDDTLSMTSSSSEESDNGYVPGLLDDPAMVQGRHR